jgi:hypothetical protein
LYEVDNTRSGHPTNWRSDSKVEKVTNGEKLSSVDYLEDIRRIEYK